MSTPNTIVVHFYWVGIEESFHCRDMPCVPDVGERLTFDRPHPGTPRPEGVVTRREWRIGWVTEVDVTVKRT